MRRSVGAMGVKRYIVVCMCLLSTLAWGQAVGTITGTVIDTSGMGISGAKVTATRTETTLSQFAVTGDGGTFTIPNLTVGTYKVTTEAQGFALESISDVTLDVSQRVAWILG